MKRDHHLKAAGFDLEEVELFDVFADGAAADLLDHAYPMVGIDNFVSDVETSVTADHEETPTRAGQERNNT